MEQLIKKITLITTGLAVGVAIGRKVKTTNKFIDSVDNLIIDLSENVKAPAIEQSAKVRALAQLLIARAKF